MFLNNRYHDPVLGTFISVDPLVTTTGEPYIYASGNPTTLSDPLGLAACSDEGNCDWLDENKTSHDRFVDSMWKAKARADKQAADLFRDEYGDSGSWGAEAGLIRYQQSLTRKQFFVDIVGSEIAGIRDIGNGLFLVDEEARGWEGPPDRQGARTAMGPTGWRPDLVDDTSPEGHLIGFFAFAFQYGNEQTTAGLRVQEWGPARQGRSQQDYDLGLIGIDAAEKLNGDSYTIDDVVRFLDTSTVGDWSNPDPPAVIAPTHTTTPSRRGSLPCYFGLTC